MKLYLSLLLLLLPLFAEESIEIQKLPSGEIQMKKSPSISPTPPSTELKIEVIDLTAVAPDNRPKIEINPTPLLESPRSAALLERSTCAEKRALPPIQIRIRDGKAFVRWTGEEQEITLDSQGRFNLQMDSDKNRIAQK